MLLVNEHTSYSMTIAPGDTRKLSTLSRLGLFGAVDLEQCAGLLAKCTSKTFKSGELLLYKDQDNRSMYVIVDGHLGLHLHENASAVVTLNPGDTVGEMSVIGEQPVSAYVKAQTECKVLEIPEELLWEFVSTDVNFARNLMKLFVRRMLDLNRLVYLRMQEEDRNNIKVGKDELTGMYSKQWLKETLPYEMTRCSMHNRALTMLMLEVDRYRNLIETYDQYTANKIFQAIANAVQIELRGMDMAVKFSEGRMALILIGTDETQGLNVAKRLHRAVEQVGLNDTKVNEKFSVSIGIAEMADEDYADLLIARTQAALARATLEGGNQTSA